MTCAFIAAFTASCTVLGSGLGAAVPKTTTVPAVSYRVRPGALVELSLVDGSTAQGIIVRTTRDNVVLGAEEDENLEDPAAMATRPRFARSDVSSVRTRTGSYVWIGLAVGVAIDAAILYLVTTSRFSYG